MGSESKQNSGKGSQKGKITWEELEKHNVASDCWLAVRIKVYDVTKWVPKHPGGVDPIALNGGRDATQLFEAYHPLSVNAVLDKYYIGDLQHDAEHPIFPPMSDFYKTLKTKIENHFTQKKISPRYAPQIIERTLLFIAIVFTLHYLSLVSTSIPVSLLCATISGIVYALICFMPVHEGSHASTTESPLVWRLLGAVHDFVNGASYYTWCHQHFLGHHPFTNVTDIDAEAIDPDIVTGDPDIRRIKPHQRWHPHYQWQQFYVPMLYGLLGIKYRINDIIIVFFSKTNGKIRLNPLDAWHMSMFILGKTFFLFYRIILPAYYFGLMKSLLLFVYSDVVTSFVLAFVFQVNHVVTQAVWPKVDKKTGVVNMDWAQMQLATTLDYGHGSYWTTFFTGALNYQVTHHLFPYISQIHYPDIAPIIKDHCKQHGITYNELPNFWEALKAHLKYLSVMGHAHSDF